MNYCVLNDFPQPETDSILIFYHGELLCSYRFLCSSVEFINLLWEIQHRGYQQIDSQQAEELILKMRRTKKKDLVDRMLLNSYSEELQLAYRAARNYYFETVRALESPAACGLELNVRQNKKEGADAIFKVVRRVYEQEHMLNECLPREFDCLPEEIIGAMYKQENGNGDSYFGHNGVKRRSGRYPWGSGDDDSLAHSLGEELPETFGEI